jgi:hypothetical protein
MTLAGALMLIATVAFVIAGLRADGADPDRYARHFPIDREDPHD